MLTFAWIPPPPPPHKDLRFRLSAFEFVFFRFFFTHESGTWHSKTQICLTVVLHWGRTLRMYVLRLTWKRPRTWAHAGIYYIAKRCMFELSHLRQDPLEAILVIFGRRALLFCLKALEKKWHHFCAHAHWWSPWRRKKCRKRAPRSVEFNFFIICDRHKRFSQNERRRADLQTDASDFFIFA